MRKRVFYIGFIFILALGSMLLFEEILSIPPGAYIIDGEWHMYHPYGSFPLNNVDTFNLDLGTEHVYANGRYRFRTTFILNEKLFNQFLVIDQQPDHGYQVFLDGKFIGEVGDMEDGRGNIWKDSGFFHLHKQLHPGVHVLELEIYIQGSTKLMVPPYLINVREHPIRYIFNIFVNKYLGSFMMGITFILSLIFISISLKNKGNRFNELLLGLSFVLWSIYLLEHLPIDFIIIDFLTFKKLVMVGFIGGFFLNVLLVNRAFKGPSSKMFYTFFTLFSLLAITLIVLPRDINTFIQFRSIAVGQCLILILILIKPGIYAESNYSNKLLSSGLIFGISYAFRYVFLELVDKPHITLFNIGLFIFLIFICLYFVSNYLDVTRQILIETQRANHYFNKSVVDPLTDVNNREILEYIDFENLNCCILICDLDDFKPINDNFGHNSGDEVLLSLTCILKKNIRESDYIIRYGGDEFVLLLIDCSIEQSEIILKKIWKEIKVSEMKYDKSNFYFSCTGGGVISKVGESFTSAVKRADKILYEVKESNKGRFKIIK